MILGRRDRVRAITKLDDHVVVTARGPRDALVTYLVCRVAYHHQVCLQDSHIYMVVEMARELYWNEEDLDAVASEVGQMIFNHSVRFVGGSFGENHIRVLGKLRSYGLQVNVAAWHAVTVVTEGRAHVLEAPAVLWVVGRVGGKDCKWSPLYVDMAPPVVDPDEAVGWEGWGSCGEHPRGADGPRWRNWGELIGFPPAYAFQTDVDCFNSQGFVKLPEIKQKLDQIQHRGVTKLHAFMGATSRRFEGSNWDRWAGRGGDASVPGSKGSGNKGRGGGEGQSSSSGSGQKGRGGGKGKGKSQSPGDAQTEDESEIDARGKGKGKGRGGGEGKGKGKGKGKK